eukprot:SAG25_NODE_256_length_10933_cov_24.263522_3_plen_77_part_00
MGLVILVGRAVDAVTDPMVGALSDRTRTRIGRRRPWLFASVAPFALTYSACWFTWDLVGEPKKRSPRPTDKISPPN